MEASSKSARKVSPDVESESLNLSGNGMGEGREGIVLSGAYGERRVDKQRMGYISVNRRFVD